MVEDLKKDKRVIDGIEFNVTQHPPLRALPLFAKLAKTVGPAFFMALDAGSALLKKDIRELGPILEELFSNLAPEDVPLFARELLVFTSATHGGVLRALVDDATINTVFAGRLPTMLKAMAFSAEVNFATFFVGSPNGSLATPAAANPST